MKLIKVESTINAPISKVWECWTKEEHVTNWNFANLNWYCPNATNNLIVGGEFHYTMSAKDNSMSFDFCGTYQKIEIKTSTMFKCPKCGARDAEYKSVQLRGPDEPATYVCRCNKCKSRFNG